MNTQSALFRVFGLALMMLAAVQAGAQPQSEISAEAACHSSGSHAKKPSKAEAQSYVCPMHADVTSAKPGKCPKCKMDLQKAKVESTVAVATHNKLVEPAVSSNTVAPTPTRNRMVIPDVQVLDQHGNALHFYTDLIKDKTVAINFIFTNCTTICPPLAATFARLQKEMGDKVGRDVHLISISVDPLTDTPERLKAWGAKFKAGPGWTFVTGEKREMDKLLNALGAAVSKREDHTPAMIIGNDSKGVWTRTYGLAKINQIVGVIQNVMAGRVEESSTSEEAKP
jgi:protein SCO1